jgi:hypothetical protein
VNCRGKTMTGALIFSVGGILAKSSSRLRLVDFALWLEPANPKNLLATQLGWRKGWELPRFGFACLFVERPLLPTLIPTCLTWRTGGRITTL